MNGRRARAFRAYQKIKSLRPARSLFNLSHEVLLTADMFKLYPCCIMEMSPGDTFHLWNRSVTRLQPLNAPVMSEIWQNTHYFFVPFRILWPEWVKFITGGEDGESGGFHRSDSHVDEDGISDFPSDSEVTPELPRWVPRDTGVGSLWDYCGFPTDVDPKGAYPEAFVKWAYNLIWNEYYRDENLQEEVDKDNEEILFRSWKKDYFTSALLSQQRGVSPSMPVNGLVTFDQKTASIALPALGELNFTANSLWCNITLPAGLDPAQLRFNSSIIDVEVYDTSSQTTTHRVQVGMTVEVGSYNSETGLTNIIGHFLNPVEIPYGVRSVSGNVTYLGNEQGGNIADAGFDVKDLRQAFQIQKWLELANRGGVRYTEFLRSFFGVSPRDDRLQRPEYIGGSKSPIIISEVLQNSATTENGTPLAYMAGHGVGAQQTYIGSYSATEYGILMGLMSFTTPPVYTQGIDRQFMRRTKYDFLFPQFTGLSEQAIEGSEIFATNSETENRKVWGFNEVYDELRSMTNKVVGKMRTVFKYWHLARFFENKPALNADFISGKDVDKRIFAVPSEEGFIVHYANIIRALRPLPKYGTPRGV